MNDEGLNRATVPVSVHHAGRIGHTAGMAELVEDATDFATLRGLPDFFSS